LRQKKDNTNEERLGPEYCYRYGLCWVKLLSTILFHVKMSNFYPLLSSVCHDAWNNWIFKKNTCAPTTVVFYRAHHARNITWSRYKQKKHLQTHIQPHVFLCMSLPWISLYRCQYHLRVRPIWLGLLKHNFECKNLQDNADRWPKTIYLISSTSMRTEKKKTIFKAQVSTLQWCNKCLSAIIH